MLSHPNAGSLSFQTRARAACAAGCMVAATLLAPACKGHGLGAGKVSLGGEASAAADGALQGSAEVQAAATKAEDAPKKASVPQKVRFCGGQLDYDGTIDYAYNSDKLQGDGTFKTLGFLLEFLKEHADVKISIEGHTDSRGDKNYNRGLSKRRAESVRAWLVENGVDKARVTATGLGEDKPKVEEPAECLNKVPKDASPCEESWAKNRRSIFAVVEGASALKEHCGNEPEPEAAPEAPPIVEAPPPPKPEECGSALFGLRANGLGPNAYGGIDLAAQPLCWLELSVGAGYKQGDVSAKVPAGEAKGTHASFTFPARGRVWFLKRFSPIVDVGVTLTRFNLDAQATDFSRNIIDYSGAFYRFVPFAGVGIGYRADRGFRVGALVGGQAPTKTMKPFTTLSDAKLYGELSLGWMF